MLEREVEMRGKNTPFIEDLDFPLEQHGKNSELKKQTPEPFGNHQPSPNGSVGKPSTR
jgi:hypothetical protein